LCTLKLQIDKIETFTQLIVTKNCWVGRCEIGDWTAPFQSAKFRNVTFVMAVCSVSVDTLMNVCGVSVDTLMNVCGVSVDTLMNVCSVSVDTLMTVCSVSVDTLMTVCSVSVDALFPFRLLYKATLQATAQFQQPLTVTPFASTHQTTVQTAAIIGRQPVTVPLHHAQQTRDQ
jgi:hypothetical protein